MRFQKIPAWHQCPKKSNILKKYKDVFMYNIHILDKARVLRTGRHQNQKLCNLHSLIITRRSITIGKVKIFKFDFYIKFYKPITNNVIGKILLKS